MSGVCPTCGGGTKAPRSLEQHRRFFAVMKAAFEHWREDHEKQFADETEFRKYVQMAVGYREVAARIPLSGMRKEQAVLIAEASIRAAGSYAVAAVHGSDLVIWKPKSIAFASLGHTSFCALNRAVDDWLYAETGMTGETILAGSEVAA